MAAPLPPQLEQLLAAVDSSINGVEVALEPYLSVPLKNLIAQMGPLDNARLNTSLAFCSSSLLFAFLRVGGVDPRAPSGPGSDPHDVMSEIASVKHLFGRCEEASKKQARSEGKQTSNLNIQAAQRFIAAGVGGAGAPAPPSASSSIAAGPGRPGATGFNRKRGRDGPSESADADEGADNAAGEAPSSAAAAQPAQKKKSEGGGSHRSTPQPALAHLGWQDEMKKRFSKK